MKNVMHARLSEEEAAYLIVVETVPLMVAARLEKLLTDARITKVRVRLDMTNLTAWKSTREDTLRFLSKSVRKDEWPSFGLYFRDKDGVFVRVSIEKQLQKESPA